MLSWAILALSVQHSTVDSCLFWYFGTATALTPIEYHHPKGPKWIVDIHMCSKFYGENGCDLDLDMVIISY